MAYTLVSVVVRGVSSAPGCYRHPVDLRVGFGSPWIRAPKGRDWDLRVIDAARDVDCRGKTERSRYGRELARLERRMRWADEWLGANGCALITALSAISPDLAIAIARRAYSAARAAALAKAA